VCRGITVVDANGTKRIALTTVSNEPRVALYAANGEPVVSIGVQGEEASVLLGSNTSHPAVLLAADGKSARVITSGSALSPFCSMEAPFAGTDSARLAVASSPSQYLEFTSSVNAQRMRMNHTPNIAEDPAYGFVLNIGKLPEAKLVDDKGSTLIDLLKGATQ
jgi:hypothetical protein